MRSASAVSSVAAAVFDELPATALGGDQPDDDALSNIWSMFLLKEAPLEE